MGHQGVNRDDALGVTTVRSLIGVVPYILVLLERVRPQLSNLSGHPSSLSSGQRLASRGYIRVRIRSVKLYQR